MDEFSNHYRKIEMLAFVVYSIIIFLFLFFIKEWVLSGIVGALTAIVNFRIQVKGIKGFADKQNPWLVTGNFYLRMVLVGAVLYLSFTKQGFNPYVVFAFIVFFHFFIFISGFFKINTKE